MAIEFRFAELENRVPPGHAGVYEVHTVDGIALKVGVAGDLRERLKQHRESRDSGLKLRPGGSFGDPNDVESKKSILAKHLYFDFAIAPDYDLQSQIGRRAFLIEKCLVRIRFTATRQEAVQLESALEKSGRFRYVKTVIVRW